MGVFDKLEKRLESAVNDVFAKAFKGEVQPVEIAARLTRELDSEAKLLSRQKKLVPNCFTVVLSRHDYDRLAPFSKTLNAEIIPELREHAGERGYVFNGPISIGYELDDQLPTGRFNVVSEARADIADKESFSEAAGQSSKLVLEVNGIRHPLTPPGILIGRGSEADLRINDPGVSRKHAKISVSATETGLEIFIEDLGSTNGVIVNGEKITRQKLQEGSRIEIGSTRMLVHSPVGV